MQFVEMGNPSGKTLMLLPGTACDYQTNFAAVLDRLCEKYHRQRSRALRLLPEKALIGKEYNLICAEEKT